MNIHGQSILLIGERPHVAGVPECDRPAYRTQDILAIVNVGHCDVFVCAGVNTYLRTDSPEATRIPAGTTGAVPINGARYFSAVSTTVTVIAVGIGSTSTTAKETA